MNIVMLSQMAKLWDELGAVLCHEFGAEICNLRRRLNLTLEEAASLVGISTDKFQAMEYSDISISMQEYLNALSRLGQEAETK